VVIAGGNVAERAIVLTTVTVESRTPSPSQVREQRLERKERIETDVRRTRAVAEKNVR